jgi:hypothetical protein
MIQRELIDKLKENHTAFTNYINTLNTRRVRAKPK